MNNRSTQVLGTMLLGLFLGFSIAHAQTADSFRFPLDGSWNITQDFGVWNSSFGGYHLGEDVLRSSEVPVYAPADAEG